MRMRPELVITKVFGGLGNQMFQYAAGSALATRLRQPLEIDIRSIRLEGVSHNGYEIAHVFYTEPTHATDQSVSRLLGWRSSRTVQRVLRRSGATALFGRYVPEPHFHPWSGFDALDSGCYLDGYWQSQRYFAATTHQLHADFAFRQPLRGSNAILAERIAAATMAVSVHVRRGDYVSSSRAAAHHGMPELDYYRMALERLTSSLALAPTCFVFSDDIAWARTNLSLPNDTVFVDHNRGSDSHFDMHLMSRCRHHIIANSSFSWWAAWLNRRADKIVIAPKRWFLTSYDTSELTPPDWIRI